jgi:uronate dehydrogenase
MRKVLITGAAGDVGTRLRRLLKRVYPELRSSDIKVPADLAAGENFVQADLAKLDEVERAVAGVEGIIHLGGFSVEGPWETILNSNIVGTYNLFEAARRQGVERIVFASSNHAVGFYPRAQKIATDVTLRPDSRYGVSKAFGEALAAMYADKHGLRVLCLRIGNVGDQPLDVRRLSIWLKPEDLVQLVRIGLEHPDLRFEVFYGASMNERAWWDNSRAYGYGYRPSGRGEDFKAAAFAAQAKLAPDPIGDYFQGGPFCSAEFSGDDPRVVASGRPLSGPAPQLVAPKGTCDTHIHFYESKYPKHPKGPAPPADATVDDYAAIQQWLGLERTVVVQPNAYGNDNRATMDAVAALGLDRARAVVVVDPDLADAELERLTKGGARGVRIMCLGGYLQWDVMDKVIARVKPFGWHPIVQFDGREFVEREAQLARIAGDYVIDHTGKFLEPVPVDSPAFKAMLRLVERGNCYVKLSAPYETSKVGPPTYADVGALAKALVKAAPERMLWASNWPHVSVTRENYPDDANLLDLLLEWAPDDVAIRKILVDNPARLYGFS